MTAITGALRHLAAERGWKPGTTLENKVALALSRFGHSPETAAQQYQIGKYRVDFAWPEAMIALEADGWWHRSPAGAARDRERDAWLRSQGWLIFRVDDHDGGFLLEHQVARVSRVVKFELEQGGRRRPPGPNGSDFIERMIGRFTAAG